MDEKKKGGDPSEKTVSVERGLGEAVGMRNEEQTRVFITPTHTHSFICQSSCPIFFFVSLLFLLRSFFWSILFGPVSCRPQIPFFLLANFICVVSGPNFGQA